jgi:hypothetical protein
MAGPEKAARRWQFPIFPIDQPSGGTQLPSVDSASLRGVCGGAVTAGARSLVLIESCFNSRKGAKAQRTRKEEESVGKNYPNDIPVVKTDLFPVFFARFFAP